MCAVWCLILLLMQHANLTHAVTGDGKMAAALPVTFSTTNKSNLSDVDALVAQFIVLYPVDEWTKHGYFHVDYLYEINAHWLQFPPRPAYQHYALAISYTFIMICGSTGNFFVIFLFLRTKSLQTPANILIVNLACSDLLMMMKMPIFIYNSVHLGPALGDYVCRLYGFVGGISGTCSICTITAISLDRYYVIKYPLKNRFSSQRAKCCVLVAWTYSGFFAAVPLFDTAYGKYTPEGFLTSCSFDYLTDSVQARLFIWSFAAAAFVLPVGALTFFYLSILRVVVRSRQAGGRQRLSGRDSRRHQRHEDTRRQELRVTMVVLSVVVVWLLAWTPYAVVAMLGVCGYGRYVTPLASMLPALFCKSAAVADPFLYALTHPKFKEELLVLLGLGRRQRDLHARSSFTMSSRHTEATTPSRTVRLASTTSTPLDDYADERIKSMQPKEDQRRNCLRRHWWFRPHFNNRADSWKSITRSFSQRRASTRSDGHAHNCARSLNHSCSDSVEEIALKNINKLSANI